MENGIIKKLNVVSNSAKKTSIPKGLTLDQQVAYQGLIEFINKPYDKNDYKRALIGAGGVGKTYLLRAVIQNCSINYSEIGLSAPSHKACRVLHDNMRGINVNINTMQSDFGLRPNYNIEDFDINNVAFATSGRVKIKNYRLYIIDESSMIPKGFLGFIEDVLKKECCKIIYVGDDHQLPPVNKNRPETESYAFKGVKSYRLTQIVRQDADNPIRELCDMLRKDIDNHTCNFINYIYRVHSKFDNTMTKGFVVYGKNDFIKEVITQFSDEAITHNTDYVKVVAFTNIAVAYYNKLIRENIIKDADKSVITTNDLITSYSTIVNEFKEDIIKNSEDYIVKEIANYTHPDYDIKGFMVKFQQVFGGNITSPLFVLDHRDLYSLTAYCKVCENLINKAKNAHANMRATKWKAYYKFKDSCLLLTNIAKPNGYSSKIAFTRDLDYGFAITANKAQGSTYNVTMVDVNDIVYDKYGNHYPNIDDINKRLYVAVSRAKEKVIFCYGV